VNSLPLGALLILSRQTNVLLLLLLVVASACDHELTTVDLTPAGGCGCVLEEVAVAPASVKLVVGDTLRLSANVEQAGGHRTFGPADSRQLPTSIRSPGS
jgi:hypothetical protein